MSQTPSNLTRRAVARLGATIAAASALPATAQAADRPSARLPPGDRLEIIELIARYAWAYDTGHLEDFLDTFTPDGSMIGFGTLIEGKPAIRTFIAGIIAARGTAGWQHLTDHHVFRDVGAKSCTVYSYYMMAEVDPQGGNGQVRAAGYYISHCRKDGGAWRFARREVCRWNSQRPW